MGSYDLVGWLADQIESGNLGGSVATGQESIELLATPFANAHFNTVAQSSNDYGGGELQSDGTQNAFVTFQKTLQSGTYTIDVYTKSGPTHGIAQLDVDGNVIASLDTYAATGALLRQTYTNYVISTTGLHDITITMNAHNASATTPFYIGVFMKLVFTRTGP